jgi:PLP dependent protein
MSSSAEAVERVRQRIARACERAGRDPGTVRLLAVSKTHGPDRIREVAACGVEWFGENRVQEAEAKMEYCPGSLHWHLIGHLQTNKVARAVRLFEMIHSVDSGKLLRAIDSAAGEAGKVLPVLIEVNVAGESTKYGVPPAELPALLDQGNGLMRTQVRGLMAIPPFAEDPEDVRPYFRALRELRDRCEADLGFDLPELSMGMSHDFEVAIEEGSTWIRVGSELFGQRGKPWRPAEDECASE